MLPTEAVHTPVRAQTFQLVEPSQLFVFFLFACLMRLEPRKVRVRTDVCTASAGISIEKVPTEAVCTPSVPNPSVLQPRRLLSYAARSLEGGVRTGVRTASARIYH